MNYVQAIRELRQGNCVCNTHCPGVYYKLIDDIIEGFHTKKDEDEIIFVFGFPDREKKSKWSIYKEKQ